MTDHIDALAVNVRRLREAHGLSLSQLGERSGIAKATLFKIERGRTNPTIDTLATIAETFEVTLADLVSAPQRALVEVVRAGEGEEVSDDATTSVILRSQVIGAGTMELNEIVFHDGKSVISAGHGVGSREHVLVRQGSISVGPVDEGVTLSTGDYATYPADRGHRWQPIDGDATVWVFHTFARAAGGPSDS